MPAAVAGNTDGHKNTTNMILLICLFVCTRQQRPIEHKIRKIDAVRSDTAGLSPPPAFVSASSSLVSFRPCSKSEVHRLIMSSQVKSSSLDPIPTFLVREFIEILLPYMTKMVNSSLAAGRLPTSQKHAIITPLMKRSWLDTADMFQAVAEDIFSWTIRPRYIVNFSLLNAPCRNIRTYLLTYNAHAQHRTACTTRHAANNKGKNSA